MPAVTCFLARLAGCARPANQKNASRKCRLPRHVQQGRGAADQPDRANNGASEKTKSRSDGTEPEELLSPLTYLGSVQDVGVRGAVEGLLTAGGLQRDLEGPAGHPAGRPGGPDSGASSHLRGGRTHGGGHSCC